MTVTLPEAVKAADELDKAMLEIANQQRSAARLPMTALFRLIAFARQGAAEQQKALGKCEVCGEGETYPFATTFALPDGAVTPLLMRRCDHCGSEFSGHIEAAANQAIVKAVRGLEVSGPLRERMATIVKRVFPLATDKENAPLVDELVATATEQTQGGM